MIFGIPFGRVMLFFLLTAALFGISSFVLNISTSNHTFSESYYLIAGGSLLLASISFVLWLIGTLFIPSTLFMRGHSLGGNTLVDAIFEIPYFRIALLSLVVSIVLSWVHYLVFPIGFTVFLVSLDMVFARLLFIVYGSA